MKPQSHNRGRGKAKKWEIKINKKGKSKIMIYFLVKLIGDLMLALLKIYD